MAENMNRLGFLKRMVLGIIGAPVVAKAVVENNPFAGVPVPKPMKYEYDVYDRVSGKYEPSRSFWLRTTRDGDGTEKHYISWDGAKTWMED